MKITLHHRRQCHNTISIKKKTNNLLKLCKQRNSTTQNNEGEEKEKREKQQKQGSNKMITKTYFIS